ncbi:hypothetical protein Tco_0863317 [Tanacetum coccineum]
MAPLFCTGSGAIGIFASPLAGAVAETDTLLGFLILIFHLDKDIVQVSYSLVICASAWYLNNGSIEYHENSFLIIYSLGKFFKGAHSFGLASCCTPCVSNVSSLWSVMLS